MSCLPPKACQILLLAEGAKNSLLNISDFFCKITFPLVPLRKKIDSKPTKQDNHMHFHTQLQCNNLWDTWNPTGGTEGRRRKSFCCFHPSLIGVSSAFFSVLSHWKHRCSTIRALKFGEQIPKVTFLTSDLWPWWMLVLQLHHFSWAAHCHTIQPWPLVHPSGNQEVKDMGDTVSWWPREVGASFPQNYHLILPGLALAGGMGSVRGVSDPLPPNLQKDIKGSTL